MTLKYLGHIILFFSLLFANQLFASPQIDSLKNELNEAEVNEKFDLLIRISIEYWSVDPKKSVDYANEALKLATITRDKEKEALAMNRIGVGYYFLQQNDKALEFFKKSFTLSEDIGDSPGICKSANNIGLIYEVYGEFDKAIEYYFKSLDIELENDNKEGIASTYLNIGNIYYRNQEYDKALDIYNKCMDIFDELHDKPGLIKSYSNVGAAYTEKEDYNKALHFSLLSYELSLSVNDKDKMANNLNNIGRIYYEISELEKALDYYNRALVIQKETSDSWSEANTCLNIASVYLDMKDYDKAYDFLNQALEKAKSVNAVTLMMKIYENFSVYYEVKKEYKKSLEFHKLFSELNDTIYNSESRRQVSEIEARYEFKNKEQRLGLFEKENEVQGLKIKTQRYIIYAVAGFGLFFLGLLLFFYYRSHVNKRERVLLLNKTTEITEQKILLEKTLAELRESESKYKTLIESIQDGIYIIQDEKIIYANEAFCELSGYTYEELCDIGPKEIVAPESYRGFSLYYSKQIRGVDVPTSLEFRLISKRGNRIDVTAYSGLVNLHGKIATIGTLKNVTKQKVYEKELIKSKEEAEKATLSKSMFIAGVSHEIRNHMNSIIGISDVLAETSLTVEQRDFLDVIQVSGNNLLNIINEILDFSKIEAGQIILEKENLSISKIFHDAISLHEYNAKKKNLYLKAVVSDKIPDRMLGDPTRLSQILINLVSNALKFTDTGGITLYADILEDKDIFTQESNDVLIKFRVVDTGIGISKSSQKKLFKPFSQTHAAVQRKMGGTGLGLVICKNLAALMNGDVGIDSELGKGSSFWFTASLVNPEITLKKTSKDNNKPKVKDFNGKKVLLVEDNLLNQHLTSKILIKEGYATDIAENGKVGLDLFMKNTYDLILMDIQMPVMDGIQATRLIRKYEKENGKKSIKIIAVTAHTKDGERQKLFNAGLDMYLSKPFKSDELIGMIAGLGL
jgi:PAS domain S-box-containing protein